jgi:hypothetical protein
VVITASEGGLSVRGADLQREKIFGNTFYTKVDPGLLKTLE